MKFLKLTQFDTQKKIIVSNNTVLFISDEGNFREITIQLHDRVLVFKVYETLDDIYNNTLLNE